MAKGTKIQLQYHEFNDPATGARITRLTPPDVTCHRNYFYQKCFTSDGSKLLFGALFDNENWNCYLLDIASGVATQLTDGKGKEDNTFGCFLTPDDKYLIYRKGPKQMRRLNLETLAEEVFYTVPEGFKGYGTWVANSDCTKMVGIEVAEGDLLPLTTWEQFREQFFLNPRCRLIVIDMATGTSRPIIDEKRWLGHPIYRPFDDNTIAFCHEGPHDLVQRMWLINEDGTNQRQLKVQEPGEACTHEFFVPDGSRMMYVSYKKGDADRWLCVADPITLENERIMSIPQCEHLYSNYDGSLAVGDGNGAAIAVSDTEGHEHENDPFMYLFDLKTRETKKICQHNSSWKVYRNDRQVTHPHPGFTPDNKRVLFSSDFEGEPAIYLVDVPA
ncbi:oligogalacturonate lyase family protein [Uliginosibacterium sp. sgz301328]|uniref:oligogalacturonate lyase family protein n=1 Tax=Uliginosibacterium sp. sgz301328 TaxID=3243764 RepID=UPI00359CF0D4